jgi:transcriptional regulator with XRE-family HTH domain
VLQSTVIWIACYSLQHAVQLWIMDLILRLFEVGELIAVAATVAGRQHPAHAHPQPAFGLKSAQKGVFPIVINVADVLFLHPVHHDSWGFNGTICTWTCGECQEQFVPMEPFASNLRKRAEALGISQAEAARRVGLSERRYGNYISGRREPDLATLVRIAELLGTTPNKLLGTEEGAPAGPKTAAKERITAALKVLSAPDLDRLSVMIGALADQPAKRSRSASRQGSAG